MCAGIMQIFYLIPAGEVPGINVHGGNVLLIQSERSRQVALFKKARILTFLMYFPLWSILGLAGWAVEWGTKTDEYVQT
jgi:hypothetical protein